MINLENIIPLSKFQRNAKAEIAQLRETGDPEVLTVKGKAAVVVQDAKAYQELLNRLEALESVEAIVEGLKSARQGEGRPMSEFAAEMRAKYDLPQANG